MDFAAYLPALARLYTDCGQAPLRLNAGASAQALDAAEAALGFALDPHLKAAWAQANGGPAWQPVFARPGFYTGYDFLSIDEALRQRQGLQARAPRYAAYVQPHARDERVRPGWFAPGWLPFASFSGATLLLMLDHSPAASGQGGQIIAFTHDPDAIDWVCAGFPALLGASLAALSDEPDEYGLLD